MKLILTSTTLNKSWEVIVNGRNIHRRWYRVLFVAKRKEVIASGIDNEPKLNQ